MTDRGSDRPDRDRTSAVARSSTGTETRSVTLAAARSIASIVRSTLGPRGLDTMLTDPEAGTIVTDDGAALLDALDAEHPAAELLLTAAREQQATVGDGTTTAVVLAGELATAATDCVEQGLHPASIAAGYDRALDHALAVTDDLAIDVDATDRETLECVARTALSGLPGTARAEHLADLAVDAVLTARDDGTVDRDRIAIHAFPGGAATDSLLLEGATVHRDPCHPDMPTAASAGTPIGRASHGDAAITGVNSTEAMAGDANSTEAMAGDAMLCDATVAVCDAGIEVPEDRRDATATVSDPDDAAAFAARDRRALAERVRRARRLDVDLLLVGGAVDDQARTWLADAGVLTLRHVPAATRQRVADATAARPVMELGELSPPDLGLAGRVARRRIRLLSPTASGQPERFLHVADCPGEDVATLLLRGGPERALEARERAVEDAIGAVATALADGAVVPGGGATHLALARTLSQALDHDARDQLAVDAYADALSAICQTLARNGGLDPLDCLVEARSRQAAGETAVGVDVAAGDVADVRDRGVLDPRSVVTSSLRTATEVTIQLLRIDDVLHADDSQGETSGDARTDGS